MKTDTTKKPPRTSITAADRLAKLIKPALKLYKRAIAGEDVTVAQQKAAEGVLRAAGLLGEGAIAGLEDKNRPVEIKFIPIKLNENDEIVSDCSQNSTEPGTNGE